MGMAEHPLTRQLASMRASHGVDQLMTMALRGRPFRHEGAQWEVIEVYRGVADPKIAAVRQPRRRDWSDAEVYFFRSTDLTGVLIEAAMPV